MLWLKNVVALPAKPICIKKSIFLSSLCVEIDIVTFSKLLFLFFCEICFCFKFLWNSCLFQSVRLHSLTHWMSTELSSMYFSIWFARKWEVAILNMFSTSFACKEYDRNPNKFSRALTAKLKDVPWMHESLHRVELWRQLMTVLNYIRS